MQPESGSGGAAAGDVPSADLSSRTVTMLVVLTLVVAFLGAWMNIHQASSLAVPSSGGVSPAPAQTSAQVSFNIEPPARETVTGLVSFEILPQG